MQMKKLILALVLTIFGFGAMQANAQVDEAYKKELTTYVKSSGTLGTFDQVIDQMTAMMGGQLNDAQKAEVKTRAIDSLIDLMVPMYKAEISIADLKEINNFYASPAGKRIAEAQPKMLNASMQMGQQWGGQLQQIIQDVTTR